MKNDNLFDVLENQKQEALPVILAPTEAMDILGVGKNTIYQLLNTRALHGIRIGRTWRIPLSFIEILVK